MTAAPSTPADGAARAVKPAALWPVGIVVAGLVCQEVGASVAVVLFPLVGALGMVALRLGFSAIILLAVARPRLRGYRRSDWLTVIFFGLALAAMNMLFYLALERLPLGTTVTIEVLGPLVLSVVVSRRASSWLWAVLAFAGVALLSQGGVDALDPLGVAFAVGAGGLWSAYILLSARSGRRFPKLDGIAIAMTVGALAALPFGIITAGNSIIQPPALLLGLAVAVLSSTIPYTFELLALRRLPEATFSILMSLAPAIAALAGLVILQQPLTWVEALAIALVIAASIGAVRAARARALSPDVTAGLSPDVTAALTPDVTATLTPDVPAGGTPPGISPEPRLPDAASPPSPTEAVAPPV